MPRTSLIDQNGIGDKVVAYSVSGMDSPQIIARIRQEHNGLTLTHDMITHHLKKRSALLHEKKAVVRNNSGVWTADLLRQSFADIVDEIRAYLEKWADDPKASAAGIRLKLDTLKELGKAWGLYAPDTVVQNNTQVVIDAKAVSERLAQYESYFQEVDRARAEETNASTNPQ